MHASPPRAIVLFVCLLLLGPLAAPSALSFGAQGHRVIGALAEARLSPAARAAVRDILAGESLAAASTWADEMRDSPDPFWGYEHAANWHFVNIPEDQTYARARRNPDGDAYAALLAFMAVLEGEDLPPGPIRAGLMQYFDGLDGPASRPALRTFALRFLVHLAGDLHQPLHMGHEEDRGGNDIALRWFGEGSNLHRVWDSQLMGAAGRSDREWLVRLEALAASLGAGADPRLESGEPSVWLAEGLELRREVYALENPSLGRAYVRAWTPVLERQLLKAGLRLAALLNRVFAQRRVPVIPR